jgi:3,4-dihydroxy 2-butanone 4-phosphate synthase/GTP cyclohydrolase II
MHAGCGSIRWSRTTIPQTTAFTVSADFRHGTTTGISAEERATRSGRWPTQCRRGDCPPGHVFPLIAREGGVLMRSGHTEACVDLCRLSGLTQVGVLAELVNDDGTVKRGAQIAAFAVEHGLRSVSVADLIAYRQRSERLVERVAEFPIATQGGPAHAIAYRTEWDAMQHLAVIFGDIRDGRGIPVRLHLESVADDVFGAKSALDSVIARFAKAGRGVIVYLREGSVGVAGADARPRDALGERQATAPLGPTRLAVIGPAHRFRDLGVDPALASRERHYVGLDGFGIAIEAPDIVDH